MKVERSRAVPASDAGERHTSPTLALRTSPGAPPTGQHLEAWRASHLRGLDIYLPHLVGIDKVSPVFEQSLVLVLQVSVLAALQRAG